MVACGPFSVKNELSYEALKDLMREVNRDKPHALILAGPFLSTLNEDISTGEIRYTSPDGDLNFVEYG